MVTTVLNLVSFALVTLGIALFAAFGIMLISKLGLRDMIIADAPKLLSMLFECDFCLSWWTCLALSILAILFSGNLLLLVSAVLATPLTRRLIV